MTRSVTRRPKVVLLGMLTKIPVGGVAWLVGQYITGFQRLGYDVYYVEAHARTPAMFMEHADDDATGNAARFLESVMRRFGLEKKWAFHALHDDGRYIGMTERQLRRLYKDAALIVNMHGGTVPTDQHAETDRLIYLGTDPVDAELQVADGDRVTIDFLDRHVAFFTWGLNYGNPDCTLPWTHRYRFVPSPPPVVVDFWDAVDAAHDAPFTTVGNWRQLYRELTYGGQTLAWSKHQQFDKVVDLPRRTNARFELALASYDADDQAYLESHGWGVRPGFELSRDLDTYRDFITSSAGEFSVAKEQNVHFRSGWFSERSATYLAAGRPVVVQDTGFGNALPTGEGLFAFSDLDGAASAVEDIVADPARHRAAAREIAHEYLNYDVVLGAILDHVGLPAKAARPTPSYPTATLPDDLALTPASRRPLVLDAETAAYTTNRPIPSVPAPTGAPDLSVVVVVLDNLACTRLTLESVLSGTPTSGSGAIAYELVVVDNGSAPETRAYLDALAARNRLVRLERNPENRGFAAAVNQAVAVSRGSRIVLLNNDTIVPPGALVDLAATLDDADVGLAGPATNRCGNAAEVDATYTTYRELADFAHERRSGTIGVFDIPVAVMFCTAIRRDVIDAVGPLDEQYEIGMFEDDDYAHRVRAAGYRVVCNDDVFVHHFGEATIGALGDAYGSVFAANKSRFEAKWGVEWRPHERRTDPQYAALVTSIVDLIAARTPAGAVVSIVTRGDDALVDLPGRTGWHLPRTDDGRYAGHHPATGTEAIALVEADRQAGAHYLVIPSTSSWWLDHYRQLRDHLDGRYARHEVDDVAIVYTLAPVTPRSELDQEVAQRPDAALVWGCRYLVERHVPAGETVAVVAKDDPALLLFDGRDAVNMPRGRDGKYLGYTFEDDMPAIAHLVALRLNGAGYLLLPESNRWWLDRYPTLAAWLAPGLLADETGVGVIFSLRRRLASPTDADPGAAGASGRAVLDAVRDGDRPLSIANWTALDLAGLAGPGDALVPAALHGDGLAYVDDSFDVVAIEHDGQRAEAERVATVAVVTVGDDGTTRVDAIDADSTAAGTAPSVRVAVIGWAGRARHDELAASLDSRFELTDVSTWAEAIDGDHDVTVLLEPGVLPLPGCIDAALRTLARRPNAGAVGVKLFAPDGSLEAAGTTVFADGSFAGVAGGTTRITAPWHDYVRPIHAATGVLVARTASLRDVEPPAEGCSPMSLVSWCAVLWSAGYEVVYQPDAAAVRIGSPIPSTTDEHDGLVKVLTPVLGSRSSRPDPLDDRSWRTLVARDDVSAGWR